MLRWGETAQYQWQNTSIDKQFSRVSHYVPVNEVLELDWTGLRTVDWKVFYNSMENKSSLKEIELSYNFNCANTKWTRDVTAWSTDQLINLKTCDDHLRRRGIHNVTVRDMVTTFTSFDSYDILNFNFIYPSSNFDTDHQSPKFNLTYVEPIRATAKAIRQTLWDDRPYAAIHIRGLDGPYAETFRGKSAIVIRTALEKAGGEIERYRKDVELDSMTLLVITDIPRLQFHSNWTIESARFSDHMANIGIKMVYRFSADYVEQISELKLRISNPYVDLCVDMQLAACANAGFGFFPSDSTFLRRILDVRLQPPVC